MRVSVPGIVLVAACALLGSCASKVPVQDSNVQAVADQPPAIVEAAHANPPAPTPSDPRERFAGWLRGRLPPGGRVAGEIPGPLTVVHTVTAGDTALTIARAYLDVTDVYRAKDLATEIGKRNPELRPGSEIEIPHLVSSPYRSANEDRMPWPADRALKGIYISGMSAGAFWPETIERVAGHGLNAIVLDAKDYMGPITYPTHVKLALDSGAGNDPPIRDFSRAIRFAHARGIYVIARISCFHDPWMAAHEPRLSLMSSSGRPFQMGWVDPANVEVQDYMVDLVREAIDQGADEVQLDYVRFPVQSRGIGSAVMPRPDGHRSQAVKAFVKRVHDVTEERHVPLSLDVFGVAASGDPSDIEALGQNLGVIGAEAEALSPMVYPSHYAQGYMGFDEPGNHPELVGIGTKAAIAKLKAGKVAGTIIRPWLQASSYKTSAYGPKYILGEIRSAEASGAVGWLMWDPGNSYWAVWQALPVVKKNWAGP